MNHRRLETSRAQGQCCALEAGMTWSLGATRRANRANLKVHVLPHSPLTESGEFQFAR
jgi:hypothetical protein